MQQNHSTIRDSTKLEILTTDMEEGVLGQTPENPSWSLEDQEEVQKRQLIIIAPSSKISLFNHYVAVPTFKPYNV